MNTQVRYPSPIRYNRSFFWPALFAFFLPSITLLLLLKNTSFTKDDSSFSLAYRGSWFWVFLWGCLFFPISLLLLALKGIDVVEEQFRQPSVTSTV